MDFPTFKESLTQPQPPTDISLALKALWFDGNGDWHRAHQVADKEDNSPEGDWVHAYLHRKEGDNWNASYWYSRAGKPKPSVSLEEEWAAIVQALLEKG